MNRSISKQTERVTAYLDQAISRGQIPGIQYVVVDANSTLFQYSGGIQDAETNTKVSDESIFLSASTTKVLTAAAVLKLAEAPTNSLNLKDPVSKHFDQHPFGNDLLICHLLNQSSGIPNPMPLSWFHTQIEHPTHDEDVCLTKVLDENSTLNAEPGTKYSYSNISYWLLGKVIEKVSGMKYSKFMETNVFEPLRISKGELSCEIEDETRYARGHQDRFSLMTFVFQLLVPRNLWDTSAGKWARFQTLYMNGASYGGVFGTALGYSKFLQDMLQDQPKLFSSESTKPLFFQDQKDSTGSTMPTTLGWHKGTLGEEPYFGKPGGGPGYCSNIRIYPNKGIATVYLCNKTEVSEGPINALSDILDEEFLENISKEGE